MFNIFIVQYLHCINIVFLHNLRGMGKGQGDDCQSPCGESEKRRTCLCIYVGKGKIGITLKRNMK